LTLKKDLKIEFYLTKEYSFSLSFDKIRVQIIAFKTK